MEKMKTAKELRKEAEAVILGKVKEKRELDTTAINEAEVTDAELAKHDLVRPGKAVWSRKAEGDLD